MLGDKKPYSFKEHILQIQKDIENEKLESLSNSNNYNRWDPKIHSKI